MPYQLRSATTGLPGQRPRRQFINGATRFFFTQLDMGFSSPLVLFSTGLIISYATWRLALSWEASLTRAERLGLSSSRGLPPQKINTRLRMSPMHESVWGFSNNNNSTAADQVITEEEHVVITGDAQNVTAEMEQRLQRPRLIHSEPSELHTFSSSSSSSSSSHNSHGELDLVCLELTEYEPARQSDVYYRSIHYVGSDVAGASTESGAAAAAEKKEDKQSRTKTTKKEEAGSESHINAYPTNTESSYLRHLPAQGTQVIHGMVKCQALSAQNNCVPVAGHVEQESARKLLLALGPTHLLRNTAKRILPLRFSATKEVAVRTLVLGLHGGELPRTLARAFPNYDVDVVEADGALVRLCRRFCGLQEGRNLRLHLANPIDYVRFLAAQAQDGGARAEAADYDLVLVDAVDGRGGLNTAYGRLDFIHHIRNTLSPRGCVALTIPNQDAGFVYNVVQNWRLAFHGRTVLLVHCTTAPCTILMTFQDQAPVGQAYIGSVVSVDEFRDLLRAQAAYYGQTRLPFDLSSEVNADNFRILAAGKTYEMAHYLPRGHPALLAAAETQRKSGPALVAQYLKAKLQRFASVAL